MRFRFRTEAGFNRALFYTKIIAWIMRRLYGGSLITVKCKLCGDAQGVKRVDQIGPIIQHHQEFVCPNRE